MIKESKYLDKILSKCKNCKNGYEVYLKIESGYDISSNPGFCTFECQLEWNKIENKRNRKLNKLLNE
jgi:hypothetical protein